MSFLTDLKNQIISQTCKSACCRRALLNGIIFSKAKLSDGEITISLENREAVGYTEALIKEIFGKDVEPTRSSLGGRAYILKFFSPACARYIESLGGGELFTERCATCQVSFLKGVFLSCGRVTDPKKKYRLEFSPYSMHESLSEMLSGLDLRFSITERKSERILYTANSTTVEDFFAAIGMNATAFMLMNSKIEAEIKNNVNRIRNCETNNIEKTVAAAGRVVELIKRLEEANKLSLLPDELEKTARLRLEFPDYSLARLAAEFTPPISKPGLSHRLNKIVELSESVLGKKDD